MRRRGLTTLLSSASAFAHLITPRASLPHVTPTAYPGISAGDDQFFGRLPGHQLFKRANTQCDGNSFFCPTGTCFVDVKAPYSGLIGCCSVSSCVPRTQCIPYTSSLTSPCDINTGGCLYCSNSAAPACLTMTNEADGQWIQYCAAYASTQTISYTPIGSYAVSEWNDGDGALTSSSASQASVSPVPGMQASPSNTASTTSAERIATETPISSAATSSASEGTASHAASSTSVLAASPGVYSLTPAQKKAGTGAAVGVIAGVAVGTFAACALLGAALWFTRRYWLRCCLRSHRDRNGDVGIEKLGSSDLSSPPGTGGADGAAPRPLSAYHSPDHVPRHAELEDRSGSVSAPWPVDTVAVRGLGIAGINQRRYAPTNPDPMSVTDEENSPTDVMPPARPGTSEMPGDRPLPPSPAVSSIPSPNTNDLSSSPGGVEAVSPVTPSYKHTSVPYTPSAYAYEPPSSVPRTVLEAPPSLPQDYSVVSLGSSGNLYRGLSQHEAAPWAYLSPEEAVKGGWRNGD